MEETKKVCTTCKEPKPLSEFSPDRKKPDGTIYYKPVCKACNNIKTKERNWKKTDKEIREGTTQKRKRQGNSKVGKEFSDTIKNDYDMDGQMQLSIPEESTPMVKSEEQATYTVETANEEKEFITGLTLEEVKELQGLLKVKDKLLSLLSHNSTITNAITTNKADRIKKTYNVDPDIVESLNKYSTDTGINQSDIINIALAEYLRVKGVR